MPADTQRHPEETFMTRIFTAIATASLFSVLSFAGIAHADSMKTDTIDRKSVV